jgi:hypothetical protein
MPTVAAARLACVVLFALACEAAADVPDVPGDDIFGFTTPTDVGNPGDTGFVNENDGRVGKRGGSYRALSAKYESGHTFAPDWWAGVSLFAARHRARGVTDIADANRAAFDGLSFEIEHRIIKRTQSNPFAVSLSVEPRWGLVDGVSGLSSHAINVAFKLFVDAAVIRDTLYWATNVIWAPQRAEDPIERNRWQSSATVLISSALAWQVSPKFFIGAETRYLASFGTMLPAQEVGHAVYVGPTFLWKVTDKIAFNATLQPQIAGRSTANSALRLDLENFERYQFRAKLSIALQ